MSTWGLLCEHDRYPGRTPDRLTLTVVATSRPYYCVTCRELIHGVSLAHSGHSIKGVMMEREDGARILSLVDEALRLASPVSKENE